jgi:hypothetical protein
MNKVCCAKVALLSTSRDYFLFDYFNGSINYGKVRAVLTVVGKEE